MDFDRLALEARFATTLQPLARRWRAEADRASRDHGLTDATGYALLSLYRLDGEARQGDLAQAIDIQGASLVRLLDLLEHDGLVLRRTDRLDRRVNHVILSERGRATVVQLETTLAAIRATMFEGIDDATLAATADVIQQLARRVTEMRARRA